MGKFADKMKAIEAEEKKLRKPKRDIAKELEETGEYNRNKLPIKKKKEVLINRGGGELSTERAESQKKAFAKKQKEEDEKELSKRKWFGSANKKGASALSKNFGSTKY